MTELSRDNSHRATRWGRRALLQRAAVAAAVGPFTLGALAACAPAPSTPTAGSTAPAAAATPAASPASSTSSATPAAGATAAPSLATSGDVKTGGTLHIGSIQEPDAIFPYANTLVVGTDVEDMIFDSLLMLDEKGQYQPRLAAAVPTAENGGISSDGTKYTVKLRSGVTWHDGQPLRSADVKFTWQTVTDPKFPAQNRVSWAGVASVETPDDSTVVFTLKGVDVAFPYYLATAFILPSHLLQGQDIPASPYFRKPVGTGPFKLVEWQSGTAIRLAKNPSYWKPDRPYLDGIVYETIPSTEGLAAKLQRQELQLRLAMNMQDQADARKYAGYQVVNTPSYSNWNFRINCEDPVLADRNVRVALCHAIDKGEISKGLMQGLVPPLWTWVGEAHWAHNPSVPKYEYDPAKAKQLLEDAGWKDAGGTRQKDGQRLSFKIANIAGDVERLQVVQVVQQFWKAVGIETEIQPIQAAAFGQVMEQPYQIAYNWAGTDYEATNSFWLRQPRNWPRYKNEEAFALMRKANATPNREERKQLHLRWQELIVPDQPEVLMFTRNYYDAVHQTVHNYKPVSWGRMTWNTDEWWLG